MRREWIVVVAAAIAAAPAVMSQQAAESPVVPLQSRTGLKMDKRIEDVRGDHTRPNEPFVIRIHAEAGYIIMPHTHPVDENIVVVRGSWSLAMGDHFRKDALHPMEVGDFGFAARNMAHFALARTDTILQVHGVGPFEVHWVVPVYELTGHGILLKAQAEDPGRSVPSAPEGCFALKLGTHVHSNYGDGELIGAQCTPGELTQYRAQRSDGSRFWGQLSELTVK